MKKTVLSVLILICSIAVFSHVSLAQNTESMVRVIYFLPKDRKPQKDIDVILGTLIKHVQEFYAVNMENHGFERKSFQIETDRHGKVIVHHVKGKFTETYYQEHSWVWDEVSKRFDMSKHIYLVAIEISTGLNNEACGLGTSNGLEGGMALLPASGVCFNSAVAAHELGHTFGLAHDKLRNANRIPSLDIADGMTTSFCAAQWLDVHRHFNMNRTYPIVDELATIRMLPPRAEPPYAIRLRFEVTDRDGLHQAQVANAAWETIAYNGLKGQSSTVEFVTTQLGITSKMVYEVPFRVIDVHGNVTQQTFPINLAPLLSHEVVSIPDVNLAAVIRETIELAPRPPIRQRDMLKLTELNASHRKIMDLTGIEHAINLRHLDLAGNRIKEVSPLSALTNLRMLNLTNNAISDVSALAGLRDQILLYLSGNPVFGNPGPKIEGPWLWMIAPTGRGGEQAAISGVDFLAQASGGSVTEQQVATKGATLGEVVGNKVWTLGKLAPIGSDNITKVVNGTGLGQGNIDNHVVYGSIVLDSPRRQETTMYVGSDDAIKVWLNGVLVHNNPVDRGAWNYQDFFPVVLNQGPNILLVAVYEHAGGWSGFFGFKNDTVYSLYLTAPTVLIRSSQRPSMYWIDPEKNGFYRLVNAKKTVENLVLDRQKITGLAIDISGGKVYWTEQTSPVKGEIRCADLDGSNVQMLKSVRRGPRDLALDVVGRRLYYTNSNGKIQRVNFDGSKFKGNLISGLDAPQHITLDDVGGKVYWTEAGTNIRRANLNGSNVKTLVSDLRTVGDIVVAGGKLYWTEQMGKRSGQIQRSDLDGSNVRTLATLRSVPLGIDVDTRGQKLYWTSAGGKIQRANLNGKRIQTVVTGLGRPVGLVLVPDSIAMEVASAPVIVLPAETTLLANFPNPFNPETWIPFQLSKAADVTLTIYAVNGQVVRRLALGHQPAGMYQNRSRAAYWDGRNAFGESVASGVYFYTLTAGDFTATRKMLIRK